MEYPKPSIIIENSNYELLSYNEFRERRGLLMISNQTLMNCMDTDRIDFTIIGRNRFIIWNRKAQDFNLIYQTKSSQVQA